MFGITPIDPEKERKRLAKGEGLKLMDAVGIEEVCARVLAGDTITDIVKGCGVSLCTFYSWVEREENKEAFARAKEKSAESWLDKGLKPLEEALYKDSGIDASAAKAYAQECARRAALRNMKYVDKTAHTISGDENGAPVKIERIERVIVNPINTDSGGI